jgi:hypothetical protein
VTSPLTTFLIRAAGERFVVGESDCATWCGRWCEACCGVDPAAPLRGRFRTVVGYKRFLKREGGLESVACRMMEAANFPLVGAPDPGTIGLVDVDGFGPTLGIAAATRRFVFRAWPAGVVFAPKGRVLRMWSPVCRR